MAKVKTAETGSRSEQSAPPDGQPLDVQLAELSAEISGIETEIERTAGIIKAAPGRIAQAKADYDAAFLRSDTTGMTAAQDRIRAANEERAAAVAKLGDFPKPIRNLRDQQAALRAKILVASETAGQAFEQARAEVGRVGRLLDAAGGWGVRLSQLLPGIQKHTGTEPAQRPREAAAPEPPAKPKCPRCGRSDEVQEVAPGRFVCRTGYHGTLTFDATGEVIGGTRPADDLSNHSRRRYDPPVDDGPRKGVGHGPRDIVTIVV